MTPAETGRAELASRLAAHPSWRWMPGMLGQLLYRDHPCAPVAEERMSIRVRDVDVDGHPDWNAEIRWMRIENHDPRPDLTDWATVGAMLGQLPSDCWLYRRKAGDWDVCRRVRGGFWRIAIGALPGEAVASALLSVWASAEIAANEASS